MAKTHIDRINEFYLKEIHRGLSNPFCQMFLQQVKEQRLGRMDQETLRAFRKWPYIQQLELASKLLSYTMHDQIEGLGEPPAKALVHFHYLAYTAHLFDESLYEIFKRERIAIQPSKQLMARIFRMKPPKVEPDDPVMADIRDKFWYFDFPAGAYPCEHVQIKSDLPVDDLKLFFRSAFWNPSYGTMALCIQSSLGTEEYVYSFHNENTSEIEISYSSGIADEQSASNMAQRVFEKIIILTLYYHTQQESTDQTGIQQLPNALKRPSAKKDKHPPKGISVFSVTSLDVAKGETNALPPSAKGREYSHSFRVMGHLRWQPYSTGRKKRKLIYIEDFIKGGNKPFMNKDQLHRLK